MIFPTVTGANLSKREFTLPFDLEGEYNIVMIAYEPSHQYELRSWLPVLETITSLYPRICYYELPTLWDFDPSQRSFIDAAMRRSIQDPKLREVTITLYVDKTDFNALLELPTEDTIYVMLIDHEGEILWRADGSADDQKQQDLLQIIRQLDESSANVTLF